MRKHRRRLLSVGLALGLGVAAAAPALGNHDADPADMEDFPQVEARPGGGGLLSGVTGGGGGGLLGPVTGILGGVTGGGDDAGLLGGLAGRL